MKDDEIRYKEMSKVERKQKTEVSKRIGINIQLIVFTIRSNYLVKFVGDFIVAIVAVAIFLWQFLDANALLSGILQYLLVHVIWAYIRGDESVKITMIIVGVNIILSIGISAISIFWGLISYFMIHMAWITLKESF